MGLIALEGMRFYAHHGYYEEERIIGNDFVADVYIETDWGVAAAADDLYQTINYETVFLICEAEMKKEYQLLEALAAHIVYALKYQFNSIQTVKVRISKLAPPLGKVVERAFVETDESFEALCGRCNQPMICYLDDTCWCRQEVVHPTTLQTIRGQFKKCLCKKCLSFYAG